MWQLARVALWLCVCVCVCRVCVHLCGCCESESRSARGAKYAMSNDRAKPQEMQPRAMATGYDFDWQRLPLDTLAKQAVVRVVVVVVVVSCCHCCCYIVRQAKIALTHS